VARVGDNDWQNAGEATSETGVHQYIRISHCVVGWVHVRLPVSHEYGLPIVTLVQIHAN